MQLLNNKNILVGVTGSIAIYKTLELVRLYIKAGANVKIVMTKSAKKFITPLTFETISQTNIIDDENENWSKNSIDNHIAIGKWADIFVIAPLSVNTLNKLANGIADNILSQIVLAYTNSILVSPAANTQMIYNPITQSNIQKLKLYNFKFIKTQSKELACRDIGDGAMADYEDIFHATIRELYSEEYWNNRKVVLTGGGTIEKIDDIRYISNFSSGKMAASLATALYYKGADVSLITTKNSIIPQDIKTILVQSTQEMYNFTKQELATKSTKKPYFFSVAAVSDYIPKSVQNGKIKKEEIGDNWDLTFKKNIDILEKIDKKSLYSVGFKAETDINSAHKNATSMLNKKGLDAVCLNIISDDNNFGSDTNEIEFITANQSTMIQKDTKINIALSIVNNLKEQFSE